MATLPEYKNIDEKKNFFVNGDVKVTINIEKIFAELDKFASTTDFIFRGCSEAKYKLYNSAQRVFLQSELYLQAKQTDERGELYDKWIESLISHCKNWNGHTVTKLLEASKIDPENSLAYLSYMQHYGVPTPLLDFTKDPYIALYFAIENISNRASDSEIDNYFSIYYTYTNHTAFESWASVFKKSIPNMKSGKIPYSDVTKNCLQLLLPDNEIYRLFNNSNIINQQGLFFYNNSPNMPQEECYKYYYRELEKGMKERGKPNALKELMVHEEFAGCFNIHKSLAPYILNKLKAKGINREFIYPDPYKLRDHAQHHSFSDIIIPRK